jgi:hypothetical protein
MSALPGISRILFFYLMQAGFPAASGPSAFLPRMGSVPFSIRRPVGSVKQALSLKGIAVRKRPAEQLREWWFPDEIHGNTFISCGDVSR